MFWLNDFDFNDFELQGIGDLLDNVDNSVSKSQNKKSEKNQNKKKKGKKSSNTSLDSPSTGRIVGTVFVGMAMSAIVGILGYGTYMNVVKYPKELEYTEKNTGLYCLRCYEDDVASLKSTGDDSYLHQEIAYANGDETRIKFYKKMASTVSYSPFSIEGVNVYGNKLVNRDDEIVYSKSTVGEGEPVITSFIDYSRVQIDKNIISILLDEADLKVGDVDYPNKLINVFCDYMINLNKEDIPLKRVKRVPYMVKDGDVYKVTPEEDIYLDRVLFSSNDFYDLMDRFAAVASTVGVNSPAWEEWNKLSDEEKANTKQPKRSMNVIPTTQEYNEWNKLSTAQKSKKEMPDKYDWKKMLEKQWCGTFYLQNEYTTKDEDGNIIRKEISAEVGDGTLKNPAGLNTDVITSIFVREKNEEGKSVTNEYPIKVRLTDYGVSEEAIKWFEDQDERNRGLDVTSEIQYVYYTFDVTNMSDKELTIYDNSSLADKNANITSRTGVMYGVTDKVKLKPDETATIESWSRSTELNKRYMLWGADFARRADPVWFRVLAGNIDDSSEDKGVTLNKTRHEE